jgi:hypothetical protein
MNVKTIILKFLVVCVVSVTIFGCASSNYSKSNTPVTVQEEWTRKGAFDWGGTRIFRIANIEFGYLRRESNHTFTVDPGETTIRVWYYANRGGGFDGMFHQTDLVDLKVALRPNGRYQVQGDYGESQVSFRVVDLATGEKVAVSEAVPIILRPSPAPGSSATIIPIFIPK